PPQPWSRGRSTLPASAARWTSRMGAAPSIGSAVTIRPPGIDEPVVMTSDGSGSTTPSRGTAAASRGGRENHLIGLRYSAPAAGRWPRASPYTSDEEKTDAWLGRVEPTASDRPQRQLGHSLEVAPVASEQDAVVDQHDARNQAVTHADIDAVAHECLS